MSQNDEPTLNDQLQRAALAKEIGDELATCTPPKVFGIHGEWGAGKTSFLYLLHLYLNGECPQAREEKASSKALAKKLWENWEENDSVTVVWFEAWRYQNEPNPVVALLHEIRAQLPFINKAWNKALKLGAVTTEGSLLSMESLTKTIGLKPSAFKKSGEDWEKQHFATPIPTNQFRGILEAAIQLFIGKQGRLLILIDDLDRCELLSALRLLEGIKIYLNLANCVFVLGMDQRVIERAISENMKHIENLDQSFAREYLEKICQDIQHLPVVHDTANLFDQFLIDRAKTGKILDVYSAGKIRVIEVIKKYNFLPSNPRKIKAFANVVRRFIKRVNYQPDEENEEETDREARILVLMAYLYHFHPKVFQHLGLSPDFFDHVRDFARDLKGGHAAFEDFALGKLPDVSEGESTAAMAELSLAARFPAAAAEVFEAARKLILSLEDLAENERTPYLGGCS